MGGWTEHGTSWYNCNRYEEKSGQDARDSQSKSRASLERYLHVSIHFSFVPLIWPARLTTRFWGGLKVLQPMAEPRAVCQTRPRAVCEDGEEDGADAADVQPHLDRGPVCQEGGRHAGGSEDDAQVDVRYGLLVSRACSPSLSLFSIVDMSIYYNASLAKNNQTALFEDNQSDLEQAVEALSELLEKPIESDTIPALRQQVTDKTVRFFLFSVGVQSTRRGA